MILFFSNIDIHLIVDLPLSSTGDHKDLSWYGLNTSSSIKIEVKHKSFISYVSQVFY